MVTPDGRFALVFNGEIYNYQELRAELRSEGAVFSSTGDTEVLLRAYEAWGPKCVERLNGMWAFAVHDKPRRKVVLSRDRLGEKPLFCARTRDWLLYASEIKSILASGLVRSEVDWPVAGRFLLDGELDTDDLTFFKGIERVPAGAVIEVAPDGEAATRRFWALGAPHSDPPADPPDALRTLFEDCVSIRLRSDVPVGVFLSGGLDSTAILSVAARAQTATQRPVAAFSYQSPDFDESRYIADTIAHTGATLTSITATARNLWESVSPMLRAQDEPVTSPTAVVGYELMRVSRANGVTVVLNGQGADETLAGYGSYFPKHWDELLARGQFRHFFEEVRAGAKRSRQSTLRAITASLCRASKQSLSRVPLYRRLTAVVPSRRRHAHGVFSRDLRRTPPLRVGHEEGVFTSALRVSVERKPLPVYLRMEDRNSMAHSVEARLPFCDYRLVSLAWALPPRWKLRGPWNKFVLREAMKGVIPESVRSRPDKMGFPTSARRWIAGEWHEPFRDLLLGSTARQRGVYADTAVVKALEDHRRGAADHTMVLFRAVQFELLCRIHGW